MVNFHEQRAITHEGTVHYKTIIEIEEDIVLLNITTKFHKILIKTIQLTKLESGCSWCCDRKDIWKYLQDGRSEVPNVNFPLQIHVVNPTSPFLTPITTTYHNLHKHGRTDCIKPLHTQWQTDRLTVVTLNSPAIVMAGA